MKSPGYEKPTGYDLWWCAYQQHWRASPCSCNIGGYSHDLTGCGWVFHSTAPGVQVVNEAQNDH